MHNDFAEKVYDTLCGYLISEQCVPGVEDAFAPGSDCDRCYEAAVEARERILQRLDVRDDADIDRIFDALLHIAWQLGLKMFAYGSRFGKGELQRGAGSADDDLKQF